MAYEVFVTDVQRQLIAAARQRTTFKRISQEIGRLLDGPWALIKATPDLSRRGRNVALYWDASGEGSIEVGVEVARPIDDTELVVSSAIPAGRAAVTAHFGEYSELRPAHDAVRAWCVTNGHALAGPFWEIYGHWEDDPAKRRTDVYYLLR